MRALTDDHVFHAFDSNTPAALTVPLSTPFSLETADCFSGQLTSTDATPGGLDWSQINPATGPVFIEGVQPGDIVRIQITSLKVGPRGTLVAIPGEGALADSIVDSETTFVENHLNEVILETTLGSVALPSRPMIGVIGLAPTPGTSVPNGTPGEHGGNMDCKLIGEGSSVYFRAAVPGGLFGAGDVHSLMGDGEVLVCGAESPAKATFIADVVDIPALPVPFFETDELYGVIAAASTADEAYRQATALFLTFMTEVVGLSVNDAGRIMTLAGDLRFCQVVDPQLTVRFELSKRILQQVGFTGIAH